MTIMALQIEVPTGIKLSSLKNPIIYFIAYIVSFTIAMAFWYNYHCLFAKVTNISKRVFWLNVIWLIMMSLFPMATGWISKYPFATLPQIFYISVYILWCLSYYALQFFLLIDNNVNLNDKEFNVVRLHAKLDIILLILAIAACYFLFTCIGNNNCYYPDNHLDGLHRLSLMI